MAERKVDIGTTNISGRYATVNLPGHKGVICTLVYPLSSSAPLIEENYTMLATPVASSETMDDANWAWNQGNGGYSPTSGIDPKQPASGVTISGGGTSTSEIFTFSNGTVSQTNPRGIWYIGSALTQDVNVSFMLIAGGNGNGGTTETTKVVRYDGLTTTFKNGNSAWATNPDIYETYPVKLGYSTSVPDRSTNFVVGNGNADTEVLHTFHGGSIEPEDGHASNAFNNQALYQFTGSFDRSAIGSDYYIGFFQQKTGNFGVWGITNIQVNGITTLVTERGENPNVVLESRYDLATENLYITASAFFTGSIMYKVFSETSRDNHFISFDKDD